MKFKSYKLLDGYLVVNDTFYYDLGSLWGIFFFIMLIAVVVSCFVGMVIGVSCGIHV